MVNNLKSKQTFRIALFSWLMTALSAVTYATVPNAPTSVSATANSSGGSVTVGFTFTPATPSINSFTVSCSGPTVSRSQTGTNSPLIVSGLLGGEQVACVVAATNLDGNSAPSSPANAVVTSAAPGTPTNVIAAAGNKQATVTFTVPSSNGAPITGYLVVSTPGGGVDSTPNNPSASHVVTGLNNGTSYTFTVAAYNSAGTGPSSSASNSVTPLGLLAVNSRKTHGGSGTYDVSLLTPTNEPFSGNVLVEPRAIGSGHKIVFQFDTPVSSAGLATVTPVGVGTASAPTFSGNEVSTTLTNVSDQRRVTVSLANVNGTSVPPVSMGFLVGDVDSSRNVTASDISSVKSKTGETTDNSNFAMDVNTSGKINAADVLAVKARNGLTLALAAAPTISTTGSFTTTIGSNYFSEFIDSQAPIASAWGVVGTLPPWVTLNPVTGYLSGKPRTSDVGTSNFTVSLTNPNGSATQAVALVVTAAPPPTVTLLSPSSGQAGASIIITGTAFTTVGTSVSIGGVAAASTVTDSNHITAVVGAMAVTGYVVVTTSGGGASATSSASLFTLLPPGVGDYSIDNPPVLLPNPSRNPYNNPPLTHSGTLGLGEFTNPANHAYRMDPTVCNSTPAIANRWQQNIDIMQYRGQGSQDLFAMGANDALTYKFTAPSIDTTGSFSYDTNISSGGAQAPVFITVSKTPCNFDTSKVIGNTNYDACYSTNLGAGKMFWTTFAAPGYTECQMVKGDTYYVNLRFQFARPAYQGGSPTTTSCTTPPCGGMFTVGL